MKRMDATAFYTLIAPRPVLLVSTVDRKGNANLAPFSFVAPLSIDPPMIAICMSRERDTYLNLKEIPEFVANVPMMDLVDKVAICAKKFERGISEFEKSGLTPVKSESIKPPRVKECIAWIECRVAFEKEFGDHVLIVGDVVNADVNDSFKERSIVEKKPLLHIGKKEFSYPSNVIRAKD